jgi:hypothetical protein
MGSRNLLNGALLMASQDGQADMVSFLLDKVVTGVYTIKYI